MFTILPPYNNRFDRQIIMKKTSLGQLPEYGMFVCLSMIIRRNCCPVATIYYLYKNLKTLIFSLYNNDYLMNCNFLVKKK